MDLSTCSFVVPPSDLGVVVLKAGRVCRVHSNNKTKKQRKKQTNRQTKKQNESGGPSVVLLLNCMVNEHTVIRSKVLSSDLTATVCLLYCSNKCPQQFLLSCPSPMGTGSGE